MIQLQENTWAEGQTERRTDQILQDPSGYRRGSNKSSGQYSKLNMNMTD